ncbi:hypothetical protein Glove_264g9 [Diversispora epigaea]|uniref:TLDc domain-containing protein n=1 Tax=Diversispora epigaea TaxID=1348612 RepID=A0A397IDS6_9GLOM|nr:hypothetical protein Glove_264g9 [Diversispora epigaea]
MKVKGTDEILGGYNPLEWNNSYDGLLLKIIWMETKDSFIFSLKNGTVQNSILSRVKYIKRAIGNVSKTFQNKYGPQFGDFYLYSEKFDFTLGENYCSIKGNNYEKPIRTSSSPNFPIVNYEVFKIVRKS